MSEIIHSILLLGPSGSGKSSFAAQAAAALGGAAIAIAPLDDERNSYVHLLDRPNYVIQGFDDSDYLPSIGERTADGHVNLLKWLRAVHGAVKSDVSGGGIPRYPLLILDTFSGMSRLAYNATLTKYNRTEAPKARGDDGAPFYGTLLQKNEEIMRITRAIHGLGVHLVVTSHVNERENVSEAAVSVAGPRMIVPAIGGGYRDIFPGTFDAVFHTGVQVVNGKSQHFLRWQPDTKRPTKSRLGALGPAALLPNDWSVVRKLMDAAVEQRRAAA